MVAAYVARKSKDGVGVEWCEHAPKPVLELLRYIAAHRPERHRMTAPPPRIRHPRIRPDEPKTIAEASSSTP